MASKKKTMVRVSVYFQNEQMMSFDLDPLKDKITETVALLKIVRGDATKAQITIRKPALCYHVVSQFTVDPTERPVLVDDVTDLTFAGD